MHSAELNLNFKETMNIILNIRMCCAIFGDTYNNEYSFFI